MKEKYIRLRANTAPDIVEIDAENLLQEFYKVIDCDCIETCRGYRDILGIRLIVDESGKLKDRPLNRMASFVFNGGDQHADYIAGTALLACVGERNGEADLVPFSETDTIQILDFLLFLWNHTIGLSRKNKSHMEESSDESN